MGRRRSAEEEEKGNEEDEEEEEGAGHRAGGASGDPGVMGEDRRSHPGPACPTRAYARSQGDQGPGLPRMEPKPTPRVGTQDGVGRNPLSLGSA